MPNWIKGKIVGKQIWAEGLFTIRVDVPGVEPFKAGQFLHLAIRDPECTAEEPDDQRRINRPYSVASPHGQELDFFIVVVPDGDLTPHLWKLEVGDEVQVSDRGAGRFTLDKSPASENLWLIATGTGLAPYIAMLRTPEPWDKYKNIIVVHGVRHAKDLAYTEELRKLETTYPGRFSLVQTLSREQSNAALFGRIPRLFENREIEMEVGIDCLPEDSTVLLCGNPAMLDSMEEVLGRRDMKEHRSKSPGQIVVERYW